MWKLSWYLFWRRDCLHKLELDEFQEENEDTNLKVISKLTDITKSKLFAEEDVKYLIRQVMRLMDM